MENKPEETENKKAFSQLELATLKEIFSLARKAAHDNVPELESIIGFEKLITPKMNASIVQIKKEPEKK